MWPFKQKKPKVLVRVHKAHFMNIMELEHVPYYFVNVLNIGTKEIFIYKIYFSWPSNFLTVSPIGRDQFPIKLMPGEQWETWIEVSSIHSIAYNDAVAVISTERGGKCYSIPSTRRINVPSLGTVPGDNL